MATLLNSALAPALALAKPRQAKQRLRWLYIHMFVRRRHRLLTFFRRPQYSLISSLGLQPSPFQCKQNHGKPSQADMKMTPAIMMTLRKVRRIRNVLQVQGGS